MLDFGELPGIAVGAMGSEFEEFDFDMDGFDIVETEDMDEPALYTRPKVFRVRRGYVCYNNALRLAKELRLEPGQRVDCFVGGNFIFGDFIEAYVTTHRAKCHEMVVSTLSLSKNNVDSLHNLTKGGWVDDLALVVSNYFYAHERHNLIPYIAETLGCEPRGRFRLAVACSHTKTCQFTTRGGRKVVMHGSANLRSSGNVEQFTMEESPELYEFYRVRMDRLIDRYAIINKAESRAGTWATLAAGKETEVLHGQDD